MENMVQDYHPEARAEALKQEGVKFSMCKTSLSPFAKFTTDNFHSLCSLTLNSTVDGYSVGVNLKM